MVTPDGAQVDDNGTFWLFHSGAGVGLVQVGWHTSTGWHVHTVDDPATSYEVPIGHVVWNRPDGATQVLQMTSTDNRGDYPLGVVALTNDSGASWHTYPGSAFPFTTATSVKVDSTGTLYVLDYRHQLWRSTDTSWTHFEKMMTGTEVLSLHSAGSSVLAQVASGSARLKVVWLSGTTHSHAVTIE